VPDFEAAYDELIAAGVDEVYCISVNDAFVMNAWKESLGVEKVKFIPDGNGFFTRQLGKNVFKANLGFGVRSWRYSAIIDSDLIEVMFSEEGQKDNCESDPYEMSKPAKLLAYLKEVPRRTELESDDDADAMSELDRLEREIFLNK
jgi:peroxiredoxin